MEGRDHNGERGSQVGMQVYVEALFESHRREHEILAENVRLLAADTQRAISNRLVYFAIAITVVTTIAIAIVESLFH